jgi:hypothetical protein
MLLASESFMISLFVWLFSFLGVTGLVIFTYLIRKKRNKEPVTISRRHTGKTVKKHVRHAAAKHSGSIGDAFREQLGDKVVAYMIEVARSDNTELVTHRVKRIKEECERLNSMKIPEENKKIISTVMIWARKFDVDRHVAELKLFRKSTQIIYDHKKRDFKLRVQAD